MMVRDPRDLDDAAEIRVMRAVRDWYCPECKKKGEARVQRTDGPVRYVRCPNCGANGKVVVML